MAGMRIPSRQIRVSYTCYHKRFYFSSSFFLLSTSAENLALRSSRSRLLVSPVLYEIRRSYFYGLKFRIFPKTRTNVGEGKIVARRRIRMGK